MEKMSSQPQRSPSTVPLARDPEGNVIELPEGAVGWRIRRQTGGRPRLQLDSRKQPMLFPLDYTVADAEDILSPGTYLLDAIDRSGEPVGVTIALSIGMSRNAESVETERDDNVPVVVPTALPSTTSDVRLVLEANVRATQMAFLHNQRTLELGLRMAETLRDSVQVLASSQADWIKSVSSARGFFRNSVQPFPPVEVKQLTVQTSDDDDGDDEEDDDREDVASEAAAEPPHWSQQFIPLIGNIAQQVGPAIMAWAAKQTAGSGSGVTESSDKKSSDDDRPPWELRDLFNWNYAYKKTAAHRERKAAEKQAAEEDAAQQAGAAEQAARLKAAIVAASSPEQGIDLMRLMQLLPPGTLAKLARIRGELAPDEQADAMMILQGFDPSTLEELLIVFDGDTVERSADALRRLVAEWRAMQAARRASSAEPPGGSGTGGVNGGGETEPR